MVQRETSHMQFERESVAPCRLSIGYGTFSKCRIASDCHLGHSIAMELLSCIMSSALWMFSASESLESGIFSEYFAVKCGGVPVAVFGYGFRSSAVSDARLVCSLSYYYQAYLPGLFIRVRFWFF